LSDLYDVEIVVKVIGGSGTAIPFLMSTDNGSSSLTFRLE
jgi:hypothetical protein